MYNECANVDLRLHKQPINTSKQPINASPAGSDDAGGSVADDGNVRGGYRVVDAHYLLENSSVETPRAAVPTHGLDRKASRLHHHLWRGREEERKRGREGGVGNTFNHRGDNTTHTHIASVCVSADGREALLHLINLIKTINTFKQPIKTHQCPMHSLFPRGVRLRENL